MSFFQVVITQALEPLEAKAQVFLLGVKLAAALDLRNTTLLTDNQVVASAVQVGSPRKHPGHWLLCPIIAEIHDIKKTKGFSVIKIDRQKNKIADALANRARRASISNSGLFSCQVLAHSPTCKIMNVIKNFNWGDMTSISVTCV